MRLACRLAVAGSISVLLNVRAHLDGGAHPGAADLDRLSGAADLDRLSGAADLDRLSGAIRDHR